MERVEQLLEVVSGYVWGPPLLVLLVSGALVTSSILQLYFQYQENQAALLTIQTARSSIFRGP